MKRPLVTACIIARDEARVIRRSLESIQDACDEICVVDTGSVDDTRAIARSFGAKVRTFIGCNDAFGRMADFSAARNACLDMARGSWILTIDADEVLGKSSAARVRRHAREDACDAVSVRLQSGPAKWAVIRLFRNAPEHRYYEPIHEWVDIPGPVCTDTSIRIRNLPDKAGKESSVARDLRLCALALERDPANARMSFYLSRALRRAQRYDDAIGEYNRYLRLQRRFTAGRHAAAHGIALCHLMAGRWRDAIRAAERALKIGPHLGETHCLLGDLYTVLGKHDLAIQSYQRALGSAPPPDDHPLFVDRSFYSSYPLRQLQRFEVTIRG